MIIKIKNGIGSVDGYDKNVIVWTNLSIHLVSQSSAAPNFVIINQFYNDEKSIYESTSKYKFCISFFCDDNNQDSHVSVLAIK